MSELKTRISRNTLFTFLAHFLKITIGFVLIPYIIAVIGKERFGLWVIVTVVTQYCGLFDLGMASPLSKYIAEYYTRRDYDNVNRVVNTGLAFYSFFGALAFTVVYYFSEQFLSLFRFSPSLHSDALFVLRIGVLVFVLEMAASCVTNILRGLQRIDLTRKVQIIYAIISGAGTIIFLKMGYGIKGLLVNDLLCFLITGAIEIWLSFKLFASLRISPKFCSREMLTRLFKFGIRVQTSRVSTLINFQLDKFLIGYYLVMEKVAYYAIGAKISFAIRQLAVLVFPILVPAFSEMSVTRSRDEIYSATVRLTKLLAFAFIPLTIFTIFSAHRIVEMWMGPGFGLSAKVVQLLSIGYLANVLPLIFLASMQGVGKPHYQMWGSLISVTLNVVLSIVLIRAIGFFGAPLGTAIAMTLAPAYFIIVIHKIYFRQPVTRSVKRILLAPLASCAAAVTPLIVYNRITAQLVYSPSRLTQAAFIALQGLFFAGCYLMLMRKLRYFSEDERAEAARYIPSAHLFL